MKNKSPAPPLSPFMTEAHRVVQERFYSCASPVEHLDLVWHTLRGMGLAHAALSENTDEFRRDQHALYDLKQDCARFQSALSIGLTSTP